MSPSNQIAFCPFCGTKFEDSTDTSVDSELVCQACEKSVSGNPENFKPPKHQKPFEYKTRLTIFGWPLVHIVYGVDQKTKKPNVARGFIAMGGVAIGGIACGGMAIGGLAFGGCAVGMVSFGGAALGLLAALGGLAVGFGLSVGSYAVGTMAVGVGAFGYYSFGLTAHGVVAFGLNNRDAVALAFFKGWRGIIAFLVGRFSSVIFALIIAPVILYPFIDKRDKKPTLSQFEQKQLELDPDSHKPFETPEPRRSFLGLLILMLVGGIFGMSSVWLILALVGFMA